MGKKLFAAHRPKLEIQMVNPDELIGNLRTDGYAVFDLPDQQPITSVRESLQAELCRRLGNSAATLETYHLFVDDDDEHLKLHVEIADFAKKHRFSRLILNAQIELIMKLFGPDIAMTVPDVLRIARPSKHCDNLGFHRDFDYGNTAYELNLFIPLVDLDTNSSLSVVPGSCKFRESELDIVDTKHPTVTKNSPRHQLGMMHSPKIISNLDRGALYAPDLKYGQALAFLPHCIHGQEVNNGQVTRWSLDFEICNSLAPINWTTSSGDPRFEVVAESFFSQEGQRKHGTLNDK